jgi:hypothetical protein
MGHLSTAKLWSSRRAGMMPAAALHRLPRSPAHHSIALRE